MEPLAKWEPYHKTIFRQLTIKPCDLNGALSNRTLEHPECMHILSAYKYIEYISTYGVNHIFFIEWHLNVNLYM